MSVVKEYHRLRRNIDRLTEGQVSIKGEDSDSDQLDKVTVVIRPNAGYYRGGQFVFTIRLDENYPSSTPPFVYCETEVYHPNIAYTDPEACMLADYYEDYELPTDRTNVCINILTEGIWNPSYGLESVVTSLLFLMHNPNFEDPLAIECAYLDKEKIEENIRKYMAGEEVEGIVYKTNFKVSKETAYKHGDILGARGEASLHEWGHGNNTVDSEIVCDYNTSEDIPKVFDTCDAVSNTIDYERSRVNTAKCHSVISSQDCDRNGISSDSETSDKCDTIISKKVERIDEEIKVNPYPGPVDGARQLTTFKNLPLLCN